LPFITASKHRGPNPFTAVILADEKETGVSFHAMTEGIDTGDVLAQHAIPITGADNAGTLLRRTSELAAENLSKLLDNIELHGLNGAPQDPALATYDKKLKGDALYLDWNQPAEVLARKVRACFPFNLALFRHRGMTVYTVRASHESTVADAPPGTIVATLPRIKVATGNGLLILETVTRYGRFPGFGQDSFAGHALANSLNNSCRHPSPSSFQRSTNSSIAANALVRSSPTPTIRIRSYS